MHPLTSDKSYVPIAPVAQLKVAVAYRSPFLRNGSAPCSSRKDCKSYHKVKQKHVDEIRLQPYNISTLPCVAGTRAHPMKISLLGLGTAKSSAMTVFEILRRMGSDHILPYYGDKNFIMPKVSSAKKKWRETSLECPVQQIYKRRIWINNSSSYLKYYFYLPARWN